MKPLKQRKLVFENKCSCVVDLALLEKAMLWFAGDHIKAKRKIFMHGRYPAISIFDKKIHVHRLIGLYLFRERIVEGMVVHHKDGDIFNCQQDNLEIMSQVIHGSHHNKGKKLTADHKRKIGEANKRRRGIKYKPKKINVDAIVNNLRKQGFVNCRRCQDTGVIPVFGGKSRTCPCSMPKTQN